MVEILRKKGMPLIILDTLKNENLHGYGIAEKIRNKYGIEKPTSGLIYPILSSLDKNGLIKVVKHGEREKKTYKLTEKGRKFLRENRETVEKTRSMLKKLGEFHGIGGRNLMKSIKELIENMDKLDKKQKQEIAKVIHETTRKIKLVVELGENIE